MVASFAADLEGWGVLVAAVGTATATVLGAMNRRTARITERHAETAVKVAGKAADTVRDVQVGQAEIKIALSNHLEQTARIIPTIEVNQRALLAWLEHNTNGGKE